MALEIVKDTAKAVTYVAPDLAARPASATLSFRAPGGDEKAAPSVTVSTVGASVGDVASVATVTSQTEITVDNATDIVAGARLWLETADGWKGVVRVSEITGTAIILESMPPGTLTTAAKLYGAEMIATIPASATGTRDLHYRLDWAVTDTAGAVAYRRQTAHVVATEFGDAVSDSDASRYTAANFPGVATGKDAGWFRRIAEQASERIRQKLIAAGNYPHRVADQGVFKSAGLVALRIELAHEGLVIAGFDPDTYLAGQEENLWRSIREALANTWVDSDDDDKVDPDDVRRMHTVRLVRP